MSFGFFLKKALSALLLPPLLPLLLLATGLLLLRRRPRLGWTLAWGGLLLAFLLSIPAGVRLLSAPLESVPVLQAADLARAQAIVILGGGHRQTMPEYGGATVNRIGLERLRYGARLARQSHLPVLLSGGTTSSSIPAEAALMAESLRTDFGIAPRWLETRSLDTQDNARFSAPMLGAAGIRRIVLVTHAAHMRRAVREFEAQGLEVIPAPTAVLLDEAKADIFSDFVPGAGAVYAGWFAAHEWLGILAQELRLAFAAGTR